ncbi:hypothetical protein [Hamadaea tsunoensis]|uniref:hypothetical protein n=1 Tax=Hamadaea tsunoensis TaxID=53368 RepID=UPI00041EEAFD|nr:hypothetical protein [Hamadaea tsunoensis]
MGYDLQAVIAPAALLRSVADPAAGMHVVDLSQGFALMPMTAEFHDRVTVLDGDSLGFWLLPGDFGATLADWSRQGPVIYAEADYFGGVGSQSAAVWRDGTLGFGPVHVPVGEDFPPEGSPISRALRYAGVDATGHHDEFEAVGLRRHRDNTAWLEEVGVLPPED